MPVISPFLEIAKGNKRGHRWVYKFGLNEDIDTSFETVWQNGGIYPTNTTAGVATVVSSTTTDTDGGVGANTVTIEGLDNDYNEISETVTMDGQTNVDTSKSFLKINRAFVATGGSSEQTGNITVTVSGNVLAYIGPDYKQTVQAHYTVPAGHTAFLENINLSSGFSDQVTCVLYQKPEGGVYRAAVTDFLYASTFSQNINSAVRFPEKTELDLRVKGTNNNNFVSAEFGLILVKNENIISHY